METIQITLDSETKNAADTLFESLGLDTLTAVKMFIVASLEVRGIPFTIQKRHDARELNNGYGTYKCEYGHLHYFDSSKYESYEKELTSAKTYTNLTEMWADLDFEDDDEVSDKSNLKI